MIIRTLIFALLANSTAVAAHAATLTGETVAVDLVSPDTSTVAAALGTSVVGPDVEATFADVISIDIDDTVVTFTYFFGGGSASFDGPGEFQGFRIRDVLGGIDDFVGVSLIASTLGSGNDPAATFDADNLFFNFRGLTISAGQSVSFQIELASQVPIPTALPLFIAGLAGLGFTGRRRSAI